MKISNTVHGFALLLCVSLITTSCLMPARSSKKDPSQIITGPLQLDLGGQSTNSPTDVPVLTLTADAYHLISMSGGTPPYTLSFTPDSPTLLGTQVFQTGFMKTAHNVGTGTLLITDAASDNLSARITTSAINTVLSTEPSIGNLWGMHNTGQSVTSRGPLAFTGTPDNDIDAPEAWSTRTDCSSVIVGIIDTGIDLVHPDLAPNLWVNGDEIPNNNIDDDNNGFVDDINGFDFVNNDGTPEDENFHGTHVAGTVGAVGGNNIGGNGVCWDVQLMALKVLDVSGSGSFSDIADAITYASDNGAMITNNSYGSGSFSQAISNAIADANNKGVLYVAAAGNGDPDFGVSQNNDAVISYPANDTATNVLSVAATDHNGMLTAFSNTGPATVDIAAPGGEIQSTFPTTVTAGMLLPAANPPNPPFNTDEEFISGTSMATPMVVGAAALLKAQEPALTHLQIKQRLLERSTPNTFLGDIGWGGLNLKNALLPAASFSSPLAEIGLGMIKLSQLDNINPGVPPLPINHPVLGQGLFVQGESFVLHLTASNVGSTSAQNVSVTFSSTDGVTVSNGAVRQIGTIAATATPSQVSFITYNLTFPTGVAGTTVNFNLNTQWEEAGKTHTNITQIGIPF